MRYNFIAFEGIDGSGKTIQSKKFAEDLNLIWTREPTNSKWGKKIREQLIKPTMTPYELQDLFIKDRKEHLETFIIPHLNSGEKVCTDRYALSMIIYGSIDSPKNVYELVKRHETQGIIKPDLTILIDVEPELSLKRINKDLGNRRKEEMFDELESLEKLKELYLNNIHVFTNDYIIIDGNPPLEQVYQNIKRETGFLNI